MTTEVQTNPKASPGHAPAVIAKNKGLGGYQTESDYQAIKGEFNQKFAKPPYVEGFWRGDVFVCTRHRPTSKPMVDEIVSRAGGREKLFTKDALEKLAQVRARLKEINAKLDEFSWGNTRAIFLRQQESLAVRSGNKINLADFASETQIDEQIDAVRTGLHNSIQGLCRETFEILNPICQAVRAAAQEIVWELDAAERKKAEKYQVQFLPSEELCTFAFFAVVRATQVLDNFTHGNGWLNPDTDIEATWQVDSLGSPARKPGTLLGSGYTEHKPNSQGVRLKEDHTKKLEEINAFNDSIRNQPQK